MEIKHKECFIPNIIRFFDLQPISRLARDAAEFVNLYSKWRGTNRFPALIQALDLLHNHPEVRQRGFAVPRFQMIRDWVAQENKPGNPALKAALASRSQCDGAELQRLLAWSEAVNSSIEATVFGIPPFPSVRESLESAAEQADLIVVSATPGEALQREWAEHDLTKFVSLIAGQEMGTKAEHLRLVAGNKYADGHVLMVGDAPGDMKAARAVGALFYPINPGAEELSWHRFHDEAIERFFNGTYKGEYEDSLVVEFDALLPEVPVWKKQ